MLARHFFVWRAYAVTQLTQDSLDALVRFDCLTAHDVLSRYCPNIMLRVCAALLRRATKRKHKDVYVHMRGRKHPSIKNKLGQIGPFWADSGILDPESCRACRREKTHRPNRKYVGWEPSVGHNSFWLPLADPARCKFVLAS